jgi:hypothetical protein
MDTIRELATASFLGAGVGALLISKFEIARQLPI